ncbi:MAG: septation protein SpoVG family protein [Candidatus Omnitrophica bacterium]|nr:septation protein SpoVG family protein [Candidatus Omnitrophota bacterium]
MKITEVRIFPTKNKEGRLKAYATMTFDDWFVIRNVKIIQGNNGVFVAMPSRKIMDSCTKCGFKNARGSRFCNDCGASIKKPDIQETQEDGRKGNDHMDIAHPIRQECRVYIQDKILEAYKQECERQEKEGDNYKPKADVGTIEDVDIPEEEDNIGNVAPKTISNLNPDDAEGQDIVM